MVVLATKCYVEGDARDRALDGMNSLVANDIGELDVDWQVGVRDDDFVQVDVSGEDAEVARNVLAETWARSSPTTTDWRPARSTSVPWSRGTTTGSSRRRRRRADSGRRDRPRQRVARAGRRAIRLVQHLSVRFVYGGDVGDPDAEPSRLSDAERDRLYDWQRGDGRLNVNSATRGEVRATVNRAGHAQDIITVERLGLLEQSVVCTEDTDPPGLLASIGSYLPAEMRCVV